MLPLPEPGRRTHSGSRLAAGYFGVQALGCVGWWWALWRWPELVALFAPGDEGLWDFWLPDLTVLVGGSAMASVLAMTQRAEAMVAGWLATGASSYGALFCLSWSVRHGDGWWAVLLMVPTALLSAVAAADLSVGVLRIFRPATSSSPRRHVLMTGLQSLLLWTTLLGLVPLAIVALEGNLGVSPAEPSPVRSAVGWALLVLTSAINLWTGLSMARDGKGTPLPMETARRLVTGGPYAVVRNPMVLAGLGQGLAVAILLGSWLVLAYVLASGLLWQLVARPAEEADMVLRFGEDYEAYRRRVACWWPRRRPRS